MIPPLPHQIVAGKRLACKNTLQRGLGAADRFGNSTNRDVAPLDERSEEEPKALAVQLIHRVVVPVLLVRLATGLMCPHQFVMRVAEHAILVKSTVKVDVGRIPDVDRFAFAILGRVMRALRQAGYSAEEIARYRTEATSGDYHHLLRVTLEWVDEPDAYPTACEGSYR